jgi:hypothetical protein
MQQLTTIHLSHVYPVFMTFFYKLAFMTLFHELAARRARCQALLAGRPASQPAGRLNNNSQMSLLKRRHHSLRTMELEQYYSKWRRANAKG